MEVPSGVKPAWLPLPPRPGNSFRRGRALLAWYLVTTKLKSESRVKENLEKNHDMEIFYPVFPPRKKSSQVGLPLFARYIFAKFDLERDFQKVQFAPGVTRVVCFGNTYIPVPEDVITCLKNRCDEEDRILPVELATGQRVRVKNGVFEGCEGIIREKRGNKRIQLLHQLAFGHSIKIEVDASEVEPCPPPRS